MVRWNTVPLPDSAFSTRAGVLDQPSPSFAGRGFSAVRVGVLSLFAVLIVGSLATAQTKPRHKTVRHATPTAASVPAGPISALTLQPQNAILDGSYSFQTLAAVGSAPDGSQRDLTESAVFTSSNPSVVRIKNGVAYPVKDGAAEINVAVGGHSAKAKIEVRNFQTDANLSFENAISPILVKNGCVGSSCHGAAKGQAGFKLSFFGYEPKNDWEAIVKANGGRRINAANPMDSLLIRKPAGLAGHGGGKRFDPDGPEARVFAAWIKAGTPFTPADNRKARAEQSGARLAAYVPDPKHGAPVLTGISVTPDERLIRQPNSHHQLIVMAQYNDGSLRDVTPFARFACDDEGIATVSSTGRLTALRKGEANVMVRFAGKVGLASVVVQPQPAPATYPNTPANNFIDAAVFAKLKKLNIVPSELCDDATFIRRAFFDIAGTPPPFPRVRLFLEDKDPNKRAKLVDELLARPEYKDYQTILWADLLRNSRTFLQEEGVRAYTHYIRDSFADNKPFDQFVRELLTGSGSTYRDDTATANYYRTTGDPSELTTYTSQIFLGVRLECCRCHNHPFDRWKEDDFYGFAAFFAKTHRRGGTAKDEEIVYTDNNGGIEQPRTHQHMEAKFLTAEQPLDDRSGDLRVKLANWITAPDNPFFAKATVNRVWKQFFGRGIVHPVDDFRATNPPINAPLLDALAQDFVAKHYDMKHLIRTICTSRVYQLSSRANESNAEDTKNFSHYYIKRLGPEQLLDAVSEATDIREQFGGVRPGTKAVNLPDNNVGSYFLDVFGRSRRLQVQERSQETTMSQALALMNGGTLNNKITDPNGRVAQLVARRGELSDRAILDQLYLAAFARIPSDKEARDALAYVAIAPTPKEGFEDVMWAMLNTREFLFNH